MAKRILIKTKEGVEISFALKEITLKGECITKFPSGDEWSDGLSKPYVYGESYVDQLPEEVVSQIASLFIPAEIEEQPQPETQDNETQEQAQE